MKTVNPRERGGGREGGEEKVLLEFVVSGRAKARTPASAPRSGVSEHHAHALGPPGWRCSSRVQAGRPRRRVARGPDAQTVGEAGSVVRVVRKVFQGP